MTDSDGAHPQTTETAEESIQFSEVTPADVRGAEFGSAVENVTFSRYLFELGSEEIASRARAAKGMGEIHHELSLKALSSQLARDTSAQVRKECVTSLTELEMAGSLPVVTRALEDKAPSVRLAALRGVYRLAAKEGLGLILGMFNDESELVRCRAATCAGWVGEEQAVSELLSLLDDKSHIVRCAAIEALGTIGANQSVSSLIDSLEDKNDAVREKAFVALGTITETYLGKNIPSSIKDREELIKKLRAWHNDGAPLEISGREESSEKGDDDKGVVTPSIAAMRRLEQQNKELLVKIKELELDLTSRNGEDEEDEDEIHEAGDYVAVSEESVDIISIVRDLERELDAAFDLKESLETDLRATQERLADESSSRQELQAQVDLLEAQADLAEQLREEISFVKEEQNVLTRKLEETSARANRLAEDREKFAEQLGISETRVKELQRDKIDIEAQLFTLKDRVKEFDEATEARQLLEEKLRNLNSQLKSTETARSSLELEVAKIREIVRNLREENENLRRDLTVNNSELNSARGRLKGQEEENAKLTEANKRLEMELDTLTTKHEATCKVLEAAKKSLREIRNAAVRTTEHFRDRYYRPSDNQ
ncbi:MAG: HEAT repeat domain-containing protein [Planctomycetes bacterium]|nr:HEAT repeat domain-containing protein [Planctomycetota bacterium]